MIDSKLPVYMHTVLVARACEQDCSLLVHPGSLFLVEGDGSDSQKALLHGIRLCFVWADEELLEEGVERLATVILALLA